jgi:DNA adenine methylase
MANATVEPRPFLRWAGGKTYLLPEIKKRIPATWNPETDLYIEPFVGAGALFWELAPKRAWLNDLNRALITTWAEFAWPPRRPLLAARLRSEAERYRRDPEAVYYQNRQRFNEAGPDEELAELAALFIFLNKTCFNGLWRVNKRGHFNVPWNKNPNAAVYDPANLAACRMRLRSARITLTACDFDQMDLQNVLYPERTISKGALIYCDPPYTPVSKTANFTAYTADGFTYADQLRLLGYAVKLKAEGAHVILSQAADESLINQYRRCGFTCDLVQVPRRVNSKGAGRGCVGEYIIF